MSRLSRHFQTPWAWLSLVSVLALFGMASWLFLAPPESPSEMIARNDRRLRELQADTQTAKARVQTAEQALKLRVWETDAESIAPSALNVVTQAVDGHRLRLGGFRPQRPADAEGLQQVGFTASVEGSYPDVLKLARTLEGSDNKLCVNMLQIAAADESSDRVTASIGLTAFRPLNPGDKP